MPGAGPFIKSRLICTLANADLKVRTKKKKKKEEREIKANAAPVNGTSARMEAQSMKALGGVVMPIGGVFPAALFECFGF